MTIAPSTRLGPYEIVAPLGAGGMSEVYRARDSQLEPSHIPSDLASSKRSGTHRRLRRRDHSMFRSLAFNVMRMLLVSLVSAATAFAAASPGKALDERFLAAFNANDLEALMACHADDAVMYPPAAFMASGKDEIRKSMGEFLGKFRISDAKISDSHALDMGNRSVTWGVITFVATPSSGGEAVVMKARFTSVIEKRGGKWVYVADHASMPMPPPGQEKSE